MLVCIVRESQIGDILVFFVCFYLVMNVEALHFDWYNCLNS